MTLFLIAIFTHFRCYVNPVFYVFVPIIKPPGWMNDFLTMALMFLRSPWVRGLCRQVCRSLFSMWSTQLSLQVAAAAVWDDGACLLWRAAVAAIQRVWECPACRSLPIAGRRRLQSTLSVEGHNLRVGDYNLSSISSTGRQQQGKISPRPTKASGSWWYFTSPASRRRRQAPQ